MRSGDKIGPPSVRKSYARDLSAGDEGNVPRAVPPPTPTSTSQAPPARHIHPCICDLTEQARRKIAEHHRKKNAEQEKLLRRIREIEEELARLEELYRMRSGEDRDMHEFYGDEYELILGKKKRKKRSARRASMVSLGVKQRIVWWKQPQIAVVYNEAHKLRCENNAYCGKRTYDLPQPRAINYGKLPLIPIRSTRTSVGRAEINLEKKKRLRAESESNSRHPPFLTAFSC